MKKNLLLLLTGCASFVFSSWGMASEVATKVPVSSFNHSASPSSYITQILFSLILILMIIFVSAWLLKRFSAFSGVSGSHLKVIGAIAVGQKEKVLILQVGEQQMVIGVTTSQITLLQSLDEPLPVLAPPPILTGSFAKRLQEALSPQKSSENESKS